MKILLSILIILTCVFIYMFRFEYNTHNVEGIHYTTKTDRLFDNHCIWDMPVELGEVVILRTGLKICD
jgi:hypothetical protein